MSSVRRLGTHGFTLVELLTVVSIVGILAAVAVALVGNHARASRTSEALAMVQSIRAAEESYRAENRRYLSVSASLTDYYPAAAPDQSQRAFFQNGTSELDKKWKLLNPVVPGPVSFVYAVVAGDAGDTIPTPSLSNPPVFAQPTGPFYVIQAVSDLDGDGEYCVVAATSFSGETVVQNAGE